MNDFKRIVISTAFVCASLAGSVIPVSAEESTVQVYRLYNRWTGEHLFTADNGEYSSLGKVGWIQEGVSWLSPMDGKEPVYRLYNSWSGEHLYTKDPEEYHTLPGYGWDQEGCMFYSDDEKEVPVYRLLNPYSGFHHYTTDSGEYEKLKSIGWKQEGLVWYGKKKDDQSTQTQPVKIGGESLPEGNSGRIVVGDYSAKLDTQNGRSPQEVVDAEDDAYYSPWYPGFFKAFIADHDGQGFDAIRNNDTAYWIRNGNDVRVLHKASLYHGINTGHGLILDDGRDFHKVPDGFLIMYCCDDFDDHVTITYWN